jgi:hypothetical protein
MAYSSSRDYPDGFEHDKEWLRQNDIEREKNGDRSLPLPRKDINFYFMCPKFDDSKDGKPSEQYY